MKYKVTAIEHNYVEYLVEAESADDVRLGVFDVIDTQTGDEADPTEIVGVELDEGDLFDEDEA